MRLRRMDLESRARRRPRSRRRNRHHRLTPVGWQSTKYFLTVCLCQCFRLSENPPTLSSSSNQSQSHQLRKRHFQEVATRHYSMADVAAAERKKPRRSVSFPASGGDARQQQQQQQHEQQQRWPPLSSSASFTSSDGVIVFRSFAPAVFRAMRAAMDIDQEDFLDALNLPQKRTSVIRWLLESVSPETEPTPYLEYTSSKSKTLLLFTYDRRFILKMERASAISRLMHILEDYIGHFIASPHSLIVKILGAYSIKIGRQKTVHLTVMQSVFWPSSRIADKFDLQGATGRSEKVPQEEEEEDDDDENKGFPEEEEFMVLKEGNFVGTDVNLGNSSRWFSEQLSRDVSFLRDVGAVDYSLLLGIQPSASATAAAAEAAAATAAAAAGSHRGRDGGKEEDLKDSYAKFASAIKRSSLGFIGGGFSSAPPSASVLSRRTISRLTGDDAGVGGGGGGGGGDDGVSINIANLAEYLDVTDDGTILVNENGDQFEDGLLLPSDEDALSAMASEILDEEDPPYPPHLFPPPIKTSSTGRKLKVKQVKFHRSVGVLDLEDYDDNCNSDGGGSRSPSPSLHFQLHPPPRDLPESPPLPPPPLPQGPNAGGGGGDDASLASTLSSAMPPPPPPPPPPLPPPAQPPRPSSRLNLRLLLPGGRVGSGRVGGGGGGSRVEPMSMSPSPYPLTPLIQEAEEEAAEEEHMRRARRGGGGGSSITLRRETSFSRKKRAPAPPSYSTRLRALPVAPVDPDRIEPAPGHFPDSQFSSLLFNWRHQFPADLLGGPDNRRLLPDSPNGVHIVDGTQHRYYLGIVDILNVHSPRRRFLGWIKSCGGGGCGASTPDKYALRFHDFMVDHL